jgi:hypothetical protein
LPLVLGLLLVAFVLSRIDLKAFIHALSPGALALLLGFALLWNSTLLTADAFATSRVYRDTVCPVRFRELWLIRGASYLPSLLNHHVGQGWITYFLAKTYGASVWRVAGATLVVYLTTFACLLGFSLSSLPLGFRGLPWLGKVLAGIVLAGVVFLILVALRPRQLAQRTLLAPVFDLGVWGLLRAVAYRAPHIVVLFLGNWVPLLIFDVHVPIVDALALIPPVLLVAALPVTPQGMGTRDVLSIHLFAAYAHGPADEAAARVLAGTLGFAAAVMLLQLTLSPLLMKRAYSLMQQRQSNAAREGA